MMRRRKLISFLLVATLSLLALVPPVSAAPTFAADLTLYRTRNKATSDNTRELAAYVTTERLFARSLSKVGSRTSVAVRSYLTALDNVDSSTRRVVRDQQASDRLLANILKLASGNHTAAASILLKRGLIGQERFLKTITATRLLVVRCRVLRAQLTPAPG